MRLINLLFIQVFFVSSFFSSLFAVGSDINYLNPFELAFDTPNTIIYGDYVSIASSVECIKNDGNCDNNYNGNLFDATTMYKNDLSTSIIPLNSSTETLQLPSDIDGSDIIFAGLYWQANITGEDEKNYNTPFNNSHNNGGIIGRDSIIMKDAGGTLHNLTADKLWYHDFWGNGTGSDGGHRSFYQAYKNVTTILQDSYIKGTTNDYTVGNIKASAGEDYGTYFWVSDNELTFHNVRIGFWGHWNLIVVYQHSNITALATKIKPKNVAIFHGFQPLIPLTPDSNKSIEITVSGFLTPKEAPVNAKMLFYGAGGEKNLRYDTLEIQDKKTSSFATIFNTTNPIDGAYNGSVSSFGVPIDNAISYYPGLDSDEFNVSTVMDTTQSSTILKLTATNTKGTGDQFFPGIIAFSTDVYEPSFCYDYAYKQQNRFFTEDNDGTQNPRIVGSVIPNEPVSITIYLKNLVSSDVKVEGMELSVVDINTSQATYIRESTLLALNTSLQSSISDNAITAVDDAFIKGIPIGDLSTNDYFYTYYDINPLKADLNISLRVNAFYNLKTSTASVPYNLNLSSEIPMCSVSSFAYTAEKGEFNIVHKKYYDLDTGGSKKFYNLPTQITKRVGNFKVISIDKDDKLTDTSAIVAIEAIDAAAFHSAYVSCQEIASSISKKVWVIFDAQKSVPFDKTALDAAYPDRTTLNPSSDLYKNARENAAFRSSSPIDTNGSLQLLEKITADTWKVKNFDYDQTQTCVSAGGTIASVCGSDGEGNSGAKTESELTSCMECIYGISTKLTCSRDNFSIRPDSFALELSDTNQTSSPKVKIVDNLSVSSNEINLAAGYKYNINISATNFLTTASSDGYIKLYGSLNDKDLMRYLWSPITSLTGCNDENNQSAIQTLSVKIANGHINFNLPPFNEVGRYALNVIDTSWTSSDSDISYMLHHNVNYSDGTSMFAKTNGTIALDCLLNTSSSENENSINLNGCDISSQHKQGEGNVVTDIMTTFKAYKFKLDSIEKTVGLNNSTANKNLYIYMADMNKSQRDEDMSFHLNGNIEAVGFTGNNLSNFVEQCYAEPLTLDINKSLITIPVAYQYIFHSLKSDGSILRTVTGDLNNSSDTILMRTEDFPKALKGVANTRLNLNFHRTVNNPQNPQEIKFANYNTNCTTTANCSFNADLDSNKIAQGILDLNNTIIKHYYGRTHAKRQRFVGKTGKVKLYYEVYCNGATCDKSLLQNGTDSTSSDDPRWFINNKHTTNFGTAGDVTQKTTATKHVTATTATTDSPATSTVKYNGTSYPYKATMQNFPDSWLIYNPFKSSATKNEFEIEFTQGGSPWTGQKETDTTTTTKATDRTNRRTMW